MAQDATSSIQRERAGGPAKAPVLIALAAALNEFGIKTASAAAAATLVIPVTATIFVYEVSSMRGAQLEREASDRIQRNAAAAGTGLPSRTAEPENRAAAAGVDAAGKLDSLLASRSAMLDTFGDDPSTVAPIYSRIIKQMLKDDDATFASLAANRAADARHLSDKESSLHEIHARLARLVGS